MPMGIRDWFLVIGGLMILGVLAHGLWIYIKSRRASVAIKYEKNIPEIDIDDIDLLRAELPSGGARVRGGAGDAGDGAPVAPPYAPEPTPAAEPAAPRPAAPSAQPATAKSGGGRESRPVNLDESVPVLMDPIDQDLAADGADRSPSRQTADADSSDEALQAPLFANEPIVPRESGRGGKRRKPAAPAPKKGADKPPAARQPEPPQEPEPEPEPEVQEVLVVNVLARDGRFAGSDLLETITRRGMRYGDMNIFHRFAGAGRRRADFSMASAVEPGTFDLGAIDDYSTPGVTFFMRLPGPSQPLEAFEDMVSIARDVAAELGGDLKDEQHSVMTAQTIEHCRQRIRDFSRRQMSRRA